MDLRETKPTDDQLRDALEFDALSHAEKITGQSYKTDAGTESLGVGLHIVSGMRRAELLRATDDTCFSETLENYLRIARAEGFEEVLIEPFAGRECTEYLYILFHPEGILLAFTTFAGDRINGGKFYYNWKPNEHPYKGPRVTSSGGWRKDGVWAGDHDCREALRFHIRQLREKGSFVTPWVEQPFLWLLTYSESEKPGYDYKAINARRIAALPEHVRKVLLPEESQEKV